MKKEIHPGVAVAAVVILLLIVGILFYKHLQNPKPQAMNPLGPGAAALHKMGGNLSNIMTPAEKQMMQRSMAGRGAGGIIK